MTDTKTYDGSNTSTRSVGVTGLQGSDTVSGLSQSFDSKNAGNRSLSVNSGYTVNDGNGGDNYTVNRASATGEISPRTITLSGSRALDKTYDGTTAATVVPGQLNSLVAGESLNVSAAGTFDTAAVDTNKAVTAKYTLANGTNGLASNYVLSNATEVLRAAILAASVNPVSPVVTPTKPSSSSRVVVSGSGSAGAAVGVADDELDTRKECSILNPEKCECQESTIPGVELCYAPSVVLNTTKD